MLQWKFHLLTRQYSSWCNFASLSFRMKDVFVTYQLSFGGGGVISVPK